LQRGFNFRLGFDDFDSLINHRLGLIQRCAWDHFNPHAAEILVAGREKLLRQHYEKGDRSR